MNIKRINKIEKMITEFNERNDYKESETAQELHKQLMYLAWVSQDESQIWSDDDYSNYLKSDNDVTDLNLKDQNLINEVREIQDEILNNLK